MNQNPEVDQILVSPYEFLTHSLGIKFEIDPSNFHPVVVFPLVPQLLEFDDKKF